MSAFSKPNTEPLAGRDSLIAYFESGNKPAADWRIGTEHEKFAYHLSDHQPIAYEGPHGVRAILAGMEQFGWQPVHEGDAVIAMSRPDGASLSLEPGGQLELSGAPLETVHQTAAELHTYCQQMTSVTSGLGVGLLPVGFHPTARREDIHWMPKGRYRIMRRYMPLVGSLGLDMMLRTCTVQVNLDYASEADMIQKMRVSTALQPLATALWANSPFYEGRPAGVLSQRMCIWEDTDPHRSGMPEFVFAEDFGFERWVDYLLDVPMYFVYRDGAYIDVAGQSFRDFLQGTLPGYAGHLPTVGDWADHMSTAFPDVRLKKYLEMRGADVGPWSRLCALPAFWVGLLYDQTALDAASALIKDWTAEDRAALRHAVPRQGLQAPIRGQSLRDIAAEVLSIARAGLERRARLDGAGRSEACYLEPLQESVASGRVPAEVLLANYQDLWGKDISRLFVPQGC